MLPFTVNHHIETLVDTFKLCVSNPHAPIADCLRPTARDLDYLWALNHQLPPYYDFCMHEVISERAAKSPDKEAISSWDGSLTYGQVDWYSSILAMSLEDSGVVHHDFIAVCFEKSRWTIVAVLAVMKAGATLVMMDPTLPLARLQNIAKQLSARTMVSSRKQHQLSKSVLPDGKHFIVDAEVFANASESNVPPSLPTVSASVLMYIIFTSGSTGTPKGVQISHGTYTSSAFPRAKAVGYNENSRVLDFASYAFDVSIDSMLLTLANGGCLCIPSDEDRLNDINEAIRKLRINYAGVTPSVARILEPDVISSLEGLGLGGEAASARDVTRWGQSTRIIIGYGPCECTIGCTINSNAATGREYVSIGPGNGAAIWIVNPNDHEALMPVGAVGELLVEGPIVGQGYLNDPEKTVAAFIEDPSWLLAGHAGYAGRRGRLYKTGDLGRYDPDGSGGIVFAGRKDTQVKLRGQRVELGEIESQLQTRLVSGITVIAEVVTPQGSGGQPTLVAFVATQSPSPHKKTDLVLVGFTEELRATLCKADAEIANILPRYMVPTAYIPVNHIPTLVSGKTDRKRLRQFGITVELRELDLSSRGSASRPLNGLEKRLQCAWGEVLKLDVGTVRLKDNFFALGGDSLSAMRLVSICRQRGLNLSVTSTFRNPTLSAMARAVQAIDLKTQEEITAFSMIAQPLDSACAEASQVCRVEPTAIEDIYPCTPTQESLFTFSLKSATAYVAQRIACIPSHISIDVWKNVWEEVVTASPILRTRLVQLQGPGLQQVVLKEAIPWESSTDLAQYLKSDRNQKMQLGDRLARYAIVHDSKGGKQYMVWTIHHVLYDGWSEPLILKKIRNALKGQHTVAQAQMRDFVKFFLDTDETAMNEFWRRELNGAVGPQFPHLPYRDYLPTPNGLIEHHVSWNTVSGWPFTLATLIRGAWALVASQYTGSDDVVFGETLTGRDIALPGVEGIIGPLIATIPIRILINRKSSVESYLQTVQRAILARTPYQHMGMQAIRKVSRDAQHACEAGTGLVIQPEQEYEVSELGFERGDPAREALHFNPYPLMLACGIRKGGFRVCASFDTGLIEESHMRRILTQLEMACVQLSKDLSQGIDQISCLPRSELNQIWKWNQTPPVDRPSGRLRAHQSIKPNSPYPRTVVPWVCDPRNPALLSPIGCTGELWLEGATLPGETVDTPPWLLAGSSEYVGRNGKVQSTGDIVRLQGDGSFVFVGRKEDIVPIQGHAVNVAELESHFSRYLPSDIRAAATMYRSSPEGIQKPALVVFVEQRSSGQQSSGEENVQMLLEEHEVELTCDASGQICKTKVCAKTSISLAITLKKLNKFLHDDLPTHMVPSNYVVVDRIPTTNGQVDHSLLNQFASGIPLVTLEHLRTRLNEVWKQHSARANWSRPESILRCSWAKVLQVSPELIDVDDNFFRLGGDSVLAMKLVSSLRSQGHNLSVADIFQHMRLRDAAKVLKVDEVSRRAPAYRPFSALSLTDKDRFLSEIIRPKLANPNWSVQDLAPVTDSQKMDILGTIQIPRTSIQYTLLFFDQGVHRAKLFRACSDLVKAHEILRTLFIEHDSSYYQVVVEDLAVPVIVQEISQDIGQFVQSFCADHIKSDFPLGSPFFKILHVQGTGGQECLILCFSHAQYDGVSLPRLLKDLEILYSGGKVTSVSFCSYVGQISNVQLQNKAVDYWRNLLDTSSLSALGGISTQPGDRGTFQTKLVDNFRAVEDITAANILTAAWALLLARRLRRSDVTFGSVTSGRMVDLPNVESVMGPCYQLTPIRVQFKAQWTAMDLLQFVQKQSSESAAYDFLGFENISKHCTHWSPEAPCFESIVHHQDWDDFSSMPFAGGTCRVDISNPHGDAPYPFKVVSYLKNGAMRVGVVGSERVSEFVGSILGDLAMIVAELTTRPSEVFCLGDLF